MSSGITGEDSFVTLMPTLVTYTEFGPVRFHTLGTAVLLGRLQRAFVCVPGSTTAPSAGGNITTMLCLLYQVLIIRLKTFWSQMTKWKNGPKGPLLLMFILSNREEVYNRLWCILEMDLPGRTHPVSCVT